MIKQFLGGRAAFLRSHARLASAVGAGLAVLVIVGAGLMLAAGSGKASQASSSPIASATFSPSPSPTASPTPSESPTLEPTDSGPTAMPSGWAYSDLDGVPAPADKAHRLPMAIMIDDNKVARPQSGISTASIVYQAMADGGEDRYMMIWQEGDATDIGPVRSARPYFVYWAAEYKALFGHFGGDAQSLQQTIPQMSKYIYNEDDLNGGACPYHRVSTRAAPHNAYTNTNILMSCLLKRGYPATFQKTPGRPFVDDTLAADLPAGQNINIPYRTGQIGYRFDPATDSYLRLVSGTVELDPANNQQVHARNVVIMYQTYGMVPSIDHLRPVVGNIGSGEAVVFKEGKAIVGTWKKTSTTAVTRLYDKSGKEIPFVRGSIFMQSVPIGTGVTYDK